MFTHKPVLLKEVIQEMNVKHGEKYIDCTLGGGGHTEQILKLGGIVLALDVDKEAVKFCENRFLNEKENKQLTIVNENYEKIYEVLQRVGWISGEVSGIIYDLGVSTFQIQEKKAGFSFEDEVVIDMRMDERLSISAADLLLGLTEKELRNLIKEYGEDPQARRLAKALKVYVNDKPKSMLTAKNIAEVIKKASKHRKRGINPATQTFQALRIAVNSELENLENSLKQVPQILDSKGKLIIISFHSLEDKIAKSVSKAPALKSLTKKPITPSSVEISRNASSRSAKMRVYEKLY